MMAPAAGSRRFVPRTPRGRWLTFTVSAGALTAVAFGAVTSASAAPGGAAVMSETFEQIADELEQLMLSRTAETGVAAEFRSVRGDPLAELTKIAAQTHADLVVVGASEHLGHRIVGSLAGRLIRAGKWPVTVVP
jgi:nucleotide-binding universal stress UspA family protein